MVHSLRVLDLFSGIGGFSFALKSISKTVAYCDINENCRQVLKKRMESGDLDKAVIFDDVCKLDSIGLVSLKPNMITAGFPCQDISLANPNGKGLKGEKSGLFYEILRIIDNLPGINIVFLENSSHIVNAGFKDVQREMVKRGFVVKYTLIRASDIGALHNRYRWYCLCVRGGVKLPRVDMSKTKLNWMKAMKMRKIIKVHNAQQKDKHVIRCKMLGNSIVPQCAMYAWNLLCNDTSKNVYVPFESVKKSSLQLTFTDGLNTITKTHWATPVFSIWHNYRSLTDRGSRLLSNQVFYYEHSHIEEGDDKKKDNSHRYIANPIFVEMLMGYPSGWTIV